MTSKKKTESKQEVFDRFEIRLSGSGGQGLVLGGVMLAEALATVDGKNVVQTQSYGPEARGGASRTDLVVSHVEIYYPKPMGLDLLLAMTQESCDLYLDSLNEGGLLVYDSHLVTQVPYTNAIGIEFTQLARNEIGIPIMANVIALGTICALTGIVTEKGLRTVVERRAPRGTEEKNIAALELGLKVGKEAKQRSKQGMKV